MTQSMTIASLEEILAFPFRDKDWQNKFLIGSLIVLSSFVIPILPLFLVYGYGVRIARRIIKGDGELHTPAWDDWSGLFVDGAKIMGVSLVYGLPLMIIAFAGQGMLIAASTVPAIVTESPGADPTMGLVVLSALLAIGGLAASGLTILLSLAMGMFVPPAIGHVIATDEFGAAFRVREWWRVFRANVGGFLLVMAIVFGIGMALVMILQILYITVCLCCLVPLLTGPISFYTAQVSFALYGRAYRAGAQSLAAQAG